MTAKQQLTVVERVLAAPKASDTSLATFIWKNAEDLWGDFKHTDFGKIILPFTLLRRLECVLEPTRESVNAMHAKVKGKGIDVGLILRQTAGLPFYNTSQYSLATLGATKTKPNLEAYIAGFSDNARIIFDQFNFSDTIARLARADNLFKICQNFAATDLHPSVVPDRVMSNIYEHLIRRFGAEVNEAAEDFMTPRDVVHLATTLLLDPDDALFRNNPGLIRTLYDPTCGTGGFLTDAMNHVEGFRAKDKVPPVLIPYGQELEPETHAVALASMLLRRLETEPARDLSANIAGPSSTLSKDAFAGRHFHYCLSNPPFGKKWEKDQAFVEREAKEKGFDGRFGAGTPRVSDGSMLFIQHLIDKMERPDKGGGRAAIILSGSPLLTGLAGQGESEIRRWLLENDYVEAIVALPADIFFRTPIGTYIWLLTNNKAKARKGRVQLIDATDIHSPLRKPEGNKRRFISDEQIAQIACLYSDFEPGERVHIVDYRDLGYRRIKVQRPLRLVVRITEESIAAFRASKAFTRLDEAGQAAWLAILRTHAGKTHPYVWLKTLDGLSRRGGLGKISNGLVAALEAAFGVRDLEAPAVERDGQPVPDKELEEFESVPLDQPVDDYLVNEVLPHVPDAWIDADYTDDKDGQRGKIGYEINFNRYFYRYIPPRDLDEIDSELKAAENEIAVLLDEMAARRTVIAHAVTKGLDAGAPMKDSGVPWLGQVPSTWDVAPLRVFLTLRRDVVGAASANTKLLSLTLQGVIERDLENPTGKMPASFDAYQRVSPGDMVFCLFDMDETPRTVGISPQEGMITGAYTVFRPSSELWARFLYYFFLHVDEFKRLKPFYKGLRKTIRSGPFLSIQVPRPPKDVAAEIVAHLDRATAQIDTLIAKTERSIELMREHRTALITAAVTGRIDLGGPG
jgi:type I restriction enzyme M protein